MSESIDHWAIPELRLTPPKLLEYEEDIKHMKLDFEDEKQIVMIVYRGFRFERVPVWTEFLRRVYPSRFVFVTQGFYHPEGDKL